MVSNKLIMVLIYLCQGAAKVSILMIGQHAIMDAYLCLLHLTAGILVGKYNFQLMQFTRLVLLPDAMEFVYLILQ